MRRSEVFVCTKFGCVIKKPGPNFKGDFAELITGVCGKPDFVRNQAEQSLERLGINRVDLLHLLRVDPDTPIEETVAAMAELVKEGK
ncbi:hypothetical protein GGI21_006425, partial [Coemansia aciculifera]